MLCVQGSRLRFRRSDKGGWEYSDDGGQTWYLTFRTESEIRAMHNITDDGTSEQGPDEDAEREVFGETLDAPIPDDLWAAITAV